MEPQDFFGSAWNLGLDSRQRKKLTDRLRSVFFALLLLPHRGAAGGRRDEQPAHERSHDRKTTPAGHGSSYRLLDFELENHWLGCHIRLHTDDDCFFVFGLLATS